MRTDTLAKLKRKLDTATSFQSGLKSVIELICFEQNWAVGHAYIVDENNSRLYPSNLWHIDQPELYQDFKAQTLETIVKPGFGLTGRVYSTQKALHTNELLKDIHFLRKESAERAGLKSAFVFPIIVNSKTVAILEFFSEKSLNLSDPFLRACERTGNYFEELVAKRKASWNDLVQQCKLIMFFLNSFLFQNIHLLEI